MGGAMTDERLAEVRELASKFTDESMLPQMLAEVDRLRAVLRDVTVHCTSERDNIKAAYAQTGGSPARYLGYADACDDVLATIRDADEQAHPPMTAATESAQDAAQQRAEQAEEHDRNYFVLSDSPAVRYAAEASIALRQARSNNQPEGTA